MKVVGLSKVIKRMQKNQKGFSLTEVVIALAVFGVIGASIVGGLNASNRVIVSAREITTAESMTRTIIEYVKRSAYDSDIAVTKLNGGVDDDDAIVMVSNTANFQDSGIVQIEDELISYSGKTGGSFTGCVRGFAGTAPVSHGDNIAVIDTPVYEVVDAGIDLSGDPYYGDYSVEIGILLLDAEADDAVDNRDDDGLQKIIVRVSYRGKLAIVTEAYKVDR